MCGDGLGRRLQISLCVNFLQSEKLWLGGRESNPDMLVQSQLSYH